MRSGAVPLRDPCAGPVTTVYVRGSLSASVADNVTARAASSGVLKVWSDATGGGFPIIATKASEYPVHARVGVPQVAELLPVTTMLPRASTAMPLPSSHAAPP